MTRTVAHAKVATLQRQSASPSRDQAGRSGEIQEVWPGIFAQAVSTLYDEQLGVTFGNELTAEQLIG